MSEYDYQILRLTDAFYAAYPNPPFNEIMKKKKRPYACLLFQTHYGYFICIPFRSEIAHGYSFRFRTSRRSRIKRSGLDYTKIVIISNPEYIGEDDAIIDKDEFNETMIHLDIIKKEALTYVEEYVAHINGVTRLHPSEFHRRYNYSTLPYFHNELGITE